MSDQSLFSRCYSAAHTSCMLSDQFIGLSHEGDEDYDLASGPQNPNGSYWVDIETDVADDEYTDRLFCLAGYRTGEYAELIGDEMEEFDVQPMRLDDCPDVKWQTYEWPSAGTEPRDEDMSQDVDFDGSDTRMISHSTHQPYRIRPYLERCERRWHMRYNTVRRNGMPESKIREFHGSQGYRGRHQATLRTHRQER